MTERPFHHASRVLFRLMMRKGTGKENLVSSNQNRENRWKVDMMDQEFDADIGLLFAVFDAELL